MCDGRTACLLFANNLYFNTPDPIVKSLADLIPVLLHVFPVDWPWYTALNLIARHAVTAAVEVVKDLTTPCGGFQPFSALFLQHGCH